MKYGFNCGIWGNLFGVPCIVADRFLKIADGSQLKVLLYLLRNNGKSFETDEIAQALDLPEDTVSDSVLFWEQHGILPSDDNSELPPVNSIFSMPSAVLPESVPQKQKNYVSYSRDSSEGLNITPSEISDMLKSNSQLSELFNTAEKYLSNFNFAVQRSLVWIYQYLGLPAEVIIMIVSYCSSVNKTYIWEIESIAVDFKRNGIDSLVLAQNEVNRLKESAETRSFIAKIKRMFSMGRDPVTKQKRFIMNWKSEKYSDELIQLAYEKAVENTGNPVRLPIEYIDAVLKRWKEKNITTVEQAEKDDIDFRSLFKKEKTESDSVKNTESNDFEDEYEALWNNY